MTETDIKRERQRLKMRGLADNAFQQITLIQSSRGWLHQICEKHAADPDFSARITELGLDYLLEKEGPSRAGHHPAATWKDDMQTIATAQEIVPAHIQDQLAQAHDLAGALRVFPTDTDTDQQRQLLDILEALHKIFRLSRRIRPPRRPTP